MRLGPVTFVVLTLGTMASLPTVGASCAASVLLCEEGGEDEYSRWECVWLVSWEGTDLACSGWSEFPDGTVCTGVYQQDVAVYSCRPGGATCTWDFRPGNPPPVCAPVFVPIPYLGDNDQLGPVLGFVGDATRDADADGNPDALEGELCGRPALRGAIDDPAVPGHCRTTTDFAGPDAIGLATGLAGAVLEIVLGAADLVLGLLDADGDAVPDAVEPTFCSLENQNSPADGTCAGSDYTPPV